MNILAGASVINSVATTGWGGIAKFAGNDNHLIVVTGKIDTASALEKGGAFYFGGTDANSMEFSLTTVIKNVQAGQHGGMAYLSGKTNLFTMD